MASDAWLKTCRFVGLYRMDEVRAAAGEALFNRSMSVSPPNRHRVSDHHQGRVMVRPRLLRYTAPVRRAVTFLLAAAALGFGVVFIWGRFMGTEQLWTRLLAGTLIAAAGVIVGLRQARAARAAAASARLPLVGVVLCALVVLGYAGVGAITWQLSRQMQAELAKMRPPEDLRPRRANQSRCPPGPPPALQIGPVEHAAPRAQLRAALDKEYQEAVRASRSAVMLEQAREQLAKKPPCESAGASALALLRRTRDRAGLALLLRTLCLPPAQRPCVSDTQLLRALSILTGRKPPAPAPNLCERLVVGWWNTRRGAVRVLDVLSKAEARVVVTAALRLDEPRFHGSTVGLDRARAWSTWLESLNPGSSAERGLLPTEASRETAQALRDLVCGPDTLRATSWGMVQALRRVESTWSLDEGALKPPQRLALLFANRRVYSDEPLPTADLWKLIAAKGNKRWIRVAAATALQHAGPAQEALSRARELVDSDDVELRAAALYALRRAPDPTLLPRVERLLQRGAPSEALAALALLMRFRRGQALPPLTRTLQRLEQAPRADALALIAARARARLSPAVDSTDHRLPETLAPEACDAVAGRSFALGAGEVVSFGPFVSTGGGSGHMVTLEKRVARAQLHVSCLGWDLFAWAPGGSVRVGRYDFDTRVLYWRGAKARALPAAGQPSAGSR
jgi:hypothetical protein